MLNITKGNSIKLRAIFSIDDTPFHVVNSNDLSVRLVSMYRAYECPYRIDVAEDDILYITVPADVSVGVYGLEVKGKLNKMDWRTFTHEVLEITYETVQGDESAVVPASDAYDVKMEVQVNKADEKDVYTKTETDDKLANKADKNSVYTKTETDKKLANKAGTDVYRQIADVDADRRAAPFGKIINEQIDTEEESYGGDVDETLICYSTALSTFVYKEFGSTKYYANWPTKKHYIGADGYPYFGKTFYCHDEDKMYVFDGIRLKAVQIPAVVAFSEPWDADIDITMGSVAEEREYPEYEVVFSKVHNRFVYKADDGKFYDNWSTRHLYIDQMSENNEPRSDVMYFAHDLGNLYIYDYEVSGTLKLINEDLSDYLKKNDHALTEFITAGQEATVVDYVNIFGNNLSETSKMHWMYFIRMQQTVVGFMDVQVSYAGDNGKIRITERLRTRALLSNDKKSIAWGTNMIWDENHEYTRFILSYNDMSQEISAGEWTAWYEEPKLTIAEKEKLADLHNYDDATVRQLIADTNDNFANYYDKQESYSAVEIDTMLRTQRQGRFVISEELPVASADTMFKIYLIPSESAKEANVKDEFITLQNGEDEYSWEQVGSTAVDLSGYSTTEEMNTAISAALSSYYSKTDIDGKLSEISTALGERYTKTEIDGKLDNKQDSISDLNDIRSGAAKGSTAYQKPAGGIPASDIASGVLPNVSDKESKMAIVETDSSDTIQAEVGKCYTFSQDVNTLAISLPAPTEKRRIGNIMMYFKTGATPAVTITSEETLLYQDGYKIDANTRYELNCLFNGKEWVVAAMKIGEE